MAWLRELGLARFVQAFRDAEITPEILPELTDADLRELGLPLGPRKVLLKACRGLPVTEPSATEARTRRLAGPLMTRSKTEPERRQLTVMFVDLVGSTALSSGLDPEDMRDVLQAYQDAVAGRIARYDGYVAKFMGDGVLAYFGFPRAHEDDAERAVRAGLDILAAVGRVREPGGESLAARVGIATGLVVVGNLIGSGAAQEQAVVGDAPNLAARLQALAEPGSAVIAASTRRLLGPIFEYADLGAHPLKGFRGPVQVWQVLSPGRAASRFEARQVETGLVPLIGREEEMGVLLRCWELARSGEGQLVLLSGEAGVGKSRLVRGLAERLGRDAGEVLTYQCSPYHTGTALHPIVDRIQREAGFGRDDTAEIRFAKLEALLAQSAAAFATPLVADLLAIPTGGRPLPSASTPPRRRALMLRVLADHLMKPAAHGPVLIVIEDAHWADPTTLELIGIVIDRLQSLPVLLVITYRQEFAPPWAHRSQEVALGRLGRHETAALVCQVTGGREVPGEVLAEILTKTDGVPLFVEELTKVVIESGLFEAGGDRSATQEWPLNFPIPDTLYASLLARLDRLASVKEVAQVGACIGREFSHELLASVASMPDDELNDALSTLVEAELVFRRDQPSGTVYAFKHALVRDAAHETLLKSRRQQLHATIAAILEERFAAVAEIQPELLARHCLEAGLQAKAVTYWHKAGRLAAGRSAMAEAVAQYTAALELLPALPPGPDRNQTELELQLALGAALNATRGWASPEMGRAYARARELCRELGANPLLPPALLGLAVLHLNRAELDPALDAVEELLRLSAQQGAVALDLVAHRVAGVIRMFRGELSISFAHLDRVRVEYQRREHALPLLVPQDTGVTGRLFLAMVTQLRGNPERALALNVEAMTLADEVAQPPTSAFALHVSCLFHQIRGDRRLVEERSTDLVKLAAEHGFPHFLGTGTFFRGWAAAEAGAHEEGISEMRRGLAAKRATGAEIKVPYYLALLAAAEAAVGRPDAVPALLAEAFDKAERTNERWILPELWRLRGETQRGDKGDQLEAERCFRRAIEIARAQGSRWWEMRAAASLTRIRAGKVECGEPTSSSPNT